MRRICYVTGSRADFGLMLPVLKALDEDPDIALSLCVTAMHLSQSHGYTIEDVRRENFAIEAEINVPLDNQLGAMATAIGLQTVKMTEVFAKSRPDIVLVLGDRGEMLAAAIAAVHLNIVVVHIHGGERSGTVDEMVRHAISKLSHYHFTATQSSRERLIKMGEHAERIFVSGAPGLDAICKASLISRHDLYHQYGLDLDRKVALLLFHPVVQEVGQLEPYIRETVKSLLDCQLQVVCLTPNSDSGELEIMAGLEEFRQHPDIHVHIHFERRIFLSFLDTVDLMVGNSSSGIIEAASFNLPVINIGSRQQLRERSANVIDVPACHTQLALAITKMLSTPEKERYHNVYGDGSAAGCIRDKMKILDLSTAVLKKINAY